MRSGLRICSRLGSASLLLLAMASFAQPQQAPAAPYYSVQLMSLSTRSAVLRELEAIKDLPQARAELRDGLYLLRIGAWEDAEPARKERDAFREKGSTSARVVKISRAVPWILPGSGAAGPETAAEPPAGTVAEPATKAAAAEPAPAKKDSATDASALAAVPPEAATPAPAEPVAPAPAPTAPAMPFMGDNPGGAANWRSALISLEQIGYVDGFSLEGSQGVRTLFFTMPPGVVADRAQLVFDVEFGDLLIPASSIQFRVNGSVRRAIRRGEVGGLQRLEIALSKNDLAEEYIQLELSYSLFLTADQCFARNLAGAYARLLPTGGLAVVSRDSAPRNVRAAWSLLPLEVRIAARLSELSPNEFQSLFQIATLLQRDGHKVQYDMLPADAPTTAHIVLAPAERYVRSGEALEGAANLRLVRSGGVPGPDGKITEERTFILIDSTRPLPAADMLRLPWRHVTSARLIDVAVAGEFPQPRNPDDTVRLEDLGFDDSERQFSFEAKWQFALPFGPLGDGQRPARAALEVFGPRLPETSGPTVVSAYFNDRLVYSTALKNRGEREVLEFELPRVQLRARNNVKVVAQRDEVGGDCSHIQAAYPLSLSPKSVIETKPMNERPATFAELVPFQRSLQLYLAKDALAAPEHVIPMLVAMGLHFWPDVPPPELRLFAPGDEVRPTGPFFVIGNAKWEPAGPVKFDQGRVQLRSNATGEPLMLLDFAADTNLTVLQMVEARGFGGAWLKTTGGYLNVPARRALFEDENLAFLGPQGVQSALRVGAARDYRVDYPEAKSWFTATGAARTALFVIAWVLILGLLVYLYRRTRRHRGA
jgi:hypothetical protein